MEKWLTGTAWPRGRPEQTSLQRPSKSCEIARASSRLLGNDDRLISLEQFSKPETSWGRDLFNEHLLDRQPRSIDSVARGSGIAEAPEAEFGSVRAEKKRPTSFGDLLEATLGSLRRVSSASTDEHGNAEGDSNLSLALSQERGLYRQPWCTDDESHHSSDTGRPPRHSMHSGRQATTRARKLRDLQQARQQRMEYGDLPLCQDHVGRETPHVVEEKRECFDPGSGATLATSLQTTDGGPILKPSPDMLTSGTTRSSGSSLSPVMLIAERFPLPKTKEFRRPSSLFLPARQASEQLAIAVRENIVDSIKKSTEKRKSNADAKILPTSDTRSTGLGKPPTTKGDDFASALDTSFRDRALPKLPRSKSCATDRHHPASFASKNGVHLQSSDISYHRYKAPSPRLHDRALLQEPAPSSKPNSTASQSPPSNEARLESQVQLLRREVRLLEAALLAVLKTGGRLNGCPCQETKANVATLGCTEMNETAIGPSEVAMPQIRETGEAKKSPLSLYLETRGHGLLTEGQYVHSPDPRS